MKSIIVTEKAIRELVVETLRGSNVRSDYDDNKQTPVVVNDVVDPSASVTDPSNNNSLPHSPAELQVAILALSKDLTSDDIPVVYDTLKKALEINLQNKRQVTMSDEKEKTRRFEEALRKQIRRMLVEIYMQEAPIDPADLAADEEELEYIQSRKNNTVSDVGGKTLSDISKELKISVAGAKRLEREALLKSQWVAKQDPAKFEVFIKQTIDDYIDQKLAGSGNISREDVEFLRAHPEEVAELPNFRDRFLHRAIHKKIKAGENLDTTM